MENNTPQLRFPEFTIEKHNNKLKKYRFEDLFHFSTGKNIKQSEASPGFETPCVRYGELYHMYNEVIYEVVNRTNFDRSELHFSEGNEILLPSAGEDPLDIGSASALTIKDVAIGRTINILKPKTDGIYSQIFVSYYINQNLKKKISSLAKGVSISNVYNSDLKKLDIILPTLPEQTKIANFLTAVDKRIKLLQKKKAELEQYKKSVMQKIFNQDIRFKDENGNDFPDWEGKMLGEICNKAQSGGTPRSTNKDFYDGDIPFLVISDMTKQGKYLTSTSKRISGLGLDNSSSWIVPVNSLIYSMYASVGFVSINKLPIATSQAVMNIILSNDVVLEFIYYHLFNFQNKIYKYVETGTQGNINAQIVKNLPIDVPCKVEQQKIASFLSSIDQSIEKVQGQIVVSQKWKKGLLQKMFV